MKTTIITIMKHFKKIRGNSLAEFATTTALMATLAATAAPKLSELQKELKRRRPLNILTRSSSKPVTSTREPQTGKEEVDSQVNLNSMNPLVVLVVPTLIMMHQ